MQYRGRWLVAALGLPIAVIAACGGSVATIDPASSSSSGGSGTGSGTGPATDAATEAAAPDAGAIVDASKPTKDAASNDPACPKTFEPPVGNCQQGLTCAYPEGSCSCVGYCGGAQPPPGIDFSHWACAPKNDACPDERPKEGSPCKGAVVCTYGYCCTQTFSCSKSGKWAAGPMQCPP